jgi:branched-chain amino acid transport system substrate-binding protein
MRRHFLRALALALLAGAPGLVSASNPAPDGEIVFGMSAPFSGPSREYGRQLKVGWEVAFQVVNDAGGIAGRKLRLIARDDGYDPVRTQVAVKYLVEDQKVFGLVGVFGSANSAAVLPYVLQHKMLYFAPYSGASILRNDPPDRYVFNFRPSYAEEAAAIVKYLVDVRRIRPSQIAVFMQQDEFGEAGRAGVARMLRKYRRDPAQALTVTYPRNTVQVEDAVKAIRQNAPRLRAVILVAVYKPAVRFIERLRSSGVDLVFANLSAVDPNELGEQLSALGPGYVKDLLVTQVVPLPTSRSSAIMKYQEALSRHAPSERPDFVSLEGYLSANVLVEGLKRAGKELNTETLVDALESIRNLDMGIGIPVGFGPSEHQASHKIWGTAPEKNGSFATVDLE